MKVLAFKPRTRTLVVSGVNAPPRGAWVEFGGRRAWVPEPSGVVGTWNITEAEVMAALEAAR